MRSSCSTGKVFGLGLCKTGTTSLCVALNALGIKAIHYPCDRQTYDELTAGNFELSILREYQAVVDIPVAPYFRELDDRYPGSRFVLTVREKRSWLESSRNHWNYLEQWGERDSQFKEFSEFIVSAVYGILRFQEDRFCQVYDDHVGRVCEYFEDRPGDLLVMDICGGEGWEKLCPFLGLPTRHAEFPRSNSRASGSSQDAWKHWLEAIDLARSELDAVCGPDEMSLVLVGRDILGDSIAGGREAVPLLHIGGRYWGDPSDDAGAISALEELRAAGAHLLVFSWPTFWWFDHYPDFISYLEANFECRLRNDRLVVFDLQSSSWEA